MPWNIFGDRKESVTPEHLGRMMADQILKEVFQPAKPLPVADNKVEWLLIKTFIMTNVVPRVFGQAVADKALRALHQQVWNVLLTGDASREGSRDDVTELNAKAGLRYREITTRLEIS